jgi:hypothetical protein
MLMTKAQELQMYRQRMEYHSCEAIVHRNNKDDKRSKEKFVDAAKHGMDMVNFAKANSFEIKPKSLLMFCQIRLQAGILEGTEEYVNEGLAVSVDDQELHAEFIKAKEYLEQTMAH